MLAVYLCLCVCVSLLVIFLCIFTLEVRGFYAVTVEFPSHMFLIAFVSVYPLKEKYMFLIQSLNRPRLGFAHFVTIN